MIIDLEKPGELDVETDDNGNEIDVLREFMTEDG